MTGKKERVRNWALITYHSEEVIKTVSMVRVAYGAAQGTYTFQSLLQALSDIDFDFSSVLWNIAEIGNAAQSIGSGGFIEGLLGTLKTIGLAITFPISLIADLLSFVYSVSVFVFSLLGFVPA